MEGKRWLFIPPLHYLSPSHTLNSACFEILGFDILLDHKLKPWLLEVRAWGEG